MAQQMLLKRPTSDRRSIDEITVSPLPSPACEQHEPTPRPHTVVHDEPGDESPEKSKPPTEHLHRQGYIIYLVLVYAVMLCTSWSILVVTSKHPLGRSGYNCYDSTAYCEEASYELADQNSRTSRYIKNAQTLLSAVSLLTIPLTSAVCAAAVVPWLQQSGQGMSLRQIMTLSDKGWTSPYIYYRLLLPSGWQRYGSSFVALALLLHALGAALSPAINQMSALIPIKVPTSAPTAPKLPLVSLHDLFSSAGSSDDRLAILKLRNMLKMINPIQIQPRIWVPYSMDCVAIFDPWQGYGLPTSNQCTNGGMTYMSLTTEPGAWVSQLSSGFATGVKTGQYIPRVSTSVDVELVDNLPLECNPVDAALLINYAGASFSLYEETRVYDWSITACIPEYSSQTFNDTDDAQTLTETAYLDIYTFDIMDNHYHNISKITMNTTIGYFELPNYINGNTPGPLLQNFTSPSRSLPSKHRRQSMPDYVFSLEENATQKHPDLQTMSNRGPLLNTLYALFGNGSLPSIYVTENATYNPGSPVRLNVSSPCLDVIPLSGLVTAYSPGNGSSLDFREQCLTYTDLAEGNQMHSFLLNFFIPTQALERVFRAAAYMSHEIWLSGSSNQLEVDYDPGQDLQIPGLDNRRITSLTIAIAVFLLSLLMLAFYASFSKTWTSSLDAHALLRIGAELGSDALPFLVVKNPHHIGELDELPGWIGDVTEDNDSKERRLGMGWSGLVVREVRPVQKKGRYLSYPRTEHRNAFQVFCLWCNAVCGLGGLRQTRAAVKVQKASAWFWQTVRKASTRMRRTRLGKWWNYDGYDFSESKEENLGYKSVAQTAIA